MLEHKKNLKSLQKCENKLYAIIDHELCLSKGILPLSFAKAFYHSGGEIIQYRNKVSLFVDVAKQSEILAEEAEQQKKILIINDYFKIASDLEVGLHIGQRDIDDNPLTGNKFSNHRIKNWGLSTHNIDEVNHALDEKPTYIGFGSVFKSQTKTELRANTMPIEQVLTLWDGPVVLIGGINLKNLDLLPKNSRIFYAAIRSFFDYGNSTRAIERYTKEFTSRLAERTF